MIEVVTHFYSRRRELGRSEVQSHTLASRLSWKRLSSNPFRSLRKVLLTTEGLGLELQQQFITLISLHSTSLR